MDPEAPTATLNYTTAYLSQPRTKRNKNNFTTNYLKHPMMRYELTTLKTASTRSKKYNEPLPSTLKLTAHHRKHTPGGGSSLVSPSQPADGAAALASPITHAASRSRSAGGERLRADLRKDRRRECATDHSGPVSGVRVS